MQTQHAPSALEQFRPALEKATALAAHSPSSHNSQPWALLRLDGDESRRAAGQLTDCGPDAGEQDGVAFLALALDRRRALAALPAHAAEMALSCGMFGQVLLRALAAQGWETAAIATAVTADEAEGAWRALRPPPGAEPLAVLALRRTPAAGGRGAGEALAAFAATVLARRTNRASYHEAPVDRETLAALLAPAPCLAADARVTVRHLRAPEERRRFARLVARYGGRDFTHRAAWRETHSYIRRDEADARAHGDGITLEQLFGPMSRPRRAATRLALTPSVLGAMSQAGYDRMLAGRLATLARTTPVITAASLPEAEPGGGDLLRAGAWLAEYWLRATEHGLALHPMSIVLQHDDIRYTLQRDLGLPGRAVFVSRLGHPTAESPAPPRRPVACLVG